MTDSEAAGLAARIAATLHPRHAHAPGNPVLQQALAANGIPGSAGGAADLTIAQDAWSFASSCGDRLIAAPPEGADLRAWLQQAAAAGLHPDLLYDASYVAADAVLLTRAPAPADPAAMIDARREMHRRERLLNQRSLSHDRAQQRAITMIHDLQDQLQIAETRLAFSRHEREIITRSTIWRATAPLRRVLNLLPRRKAADQKVQQGLGPTAYERWVALHDTLSDADRAAIHTQIATLPARPVISVVMPAYDTEESLLRAAIRSVQDQIYPHWQLCIADDASPSPHVAHVLGELAEQDARITWVRLPINGNISAATNAALSLATGEFVALMDHDDLLPAHALYEVAAELADHPDADLIYSDEDQIDAAGRRAKPYFKPGWNIDLMLAHNMVSHLGVYRRSLLMQLGGMRLGYEGSQDYDLALRAADASTPSRIRHIPRVLYHWRQHTTSFSKEQLDACVSAARRAIADHLQRTNEADRASVRPAPSIPTWTRISWHLPSPPPRVSLIVPTRDRPELLRTCTQGLLHRTDYPNIELIIADNDTSDPGALALFAELRQDPRVRILPCPGPFNFAAINNAAADAAAGEVLALVNNDIDVMGPDWLAEMVSQAVRPGIGAVGARLLYANNSVQHVGVVLGVGTFDGGPGVAGHYSLEDDETSLGYFGASALVHEVSAVTAACMVLTRSAYQAAGGMDAEHLKVAFNDVDLCLRLRAAGLRNLFTPYAELHHHESASRGNDLAPEHRARFDHECRTMRERWGAELDRDPFYNRNFSRIDGLFRLMGPPGRRSWE